MMNCAAKFITSSDQILNLPSDLNEKYTVKFHIKFVKIHHIITFQFKSMIFH